MHTIQPVAVVAGLIALSSCSQPIDEDGNADAGLGTLETSRTPPPHQPPVSVPAFPSSANTGRPVIRAECSERGQRLEPTMEQAKANTYGIWQRCSFRAEYGWSATHPLSHEYLELRDGSWHVIEAGGDGLFHRGLDLDHSGPISYPSAQQGNDIFVYLDTPTGGSVMTKPRFEQAARLRMRLDVYMFDNADYVQLYPATP